MLVEDPIFPSIFQITEVLEDVDVSCTKPTKLHLKEPLAEGEEEEWEFTINSKVVTTIIYGLFMYVMMLYVIWYLLIILLNLVYELLSYMYVILV